MLLGHWNKLVQSVLTNWVVNPLNQYPSISRFFNNPRFVIRISYSVQRISYSVLRTACFVPRILFLVCFCLWSFSWSLVIGYSYFLSCIPHLFSCILFLLPSFTLWLLVIGYSSSPLFHFLLYPVYRACPDLSGLSRLIFFYCFLFFAFLAPLRENLSVFFLPLNIGYWILVIGYSSFPLGLQSWKSIRASARTFSTTSSSGS